MPKGSVHCFTSASFSYLDRARVLAEGLRRHHPDWTLWLCLVDRLPPGFDFDPNGELFDHIVQVEELQIAEPRRWIFGHDIVEACTAVKGAMVVRLLEVGAKRVIYLDPDIAVFAPLESPLALLEDADVVLTPHLLEPETNSIGVRDNEICALQHGVYNLGFLGVSATDEGWRFARWWRDRLETYCLDDIPAGLFTDQRWCDHVPVFFPGARVVRDPGCNVASWNVAHRPITIDSEGTIYAGAVPLRFFHFTKFVGVGRAILERNSGMSSALEEVMAWYGATLAAHTPKGLPRDWWAYGRYVDGVAISRGHRRRWRVDAGLRERIADPFAITSTEFLAAIGDG